MAYDYTAMPTVDDVKAMCLAAHVDTTDSAFTMTDAQITGIIAARARSLEKKTQRQFVAGSSGEVRYFDGSGTGIMFVDEYVTVTAVDFFYVPATTVVSVTNFVQVEQQPWANEKIQILQGQANISYGFFLRFPEGRSNIKVTGTWGYGSTVPEDVFLAVLQAATADVLMTNTLSAQGQTLKYIDGDASEQWSDDTIGMSSGWLGKGSLWEEVCRNYKRSLKSHHRKSRPKLY